MITTTRDLAHFIVNMADVENEFGALVSPEISVCSVDGKEFVIKDFYLRGDNKAVMVLHEKNK